MKFDYLRLLRYIVFVFAITCVACDEDEMKDGGLPPDYVDPEDPTDEDPIGEDPTVYNYIVPQVGSDGRIAVLGTPPMYTDTATKHVVSVAYDIDASKAYDLANYYKAANGKSGDALKTAIAYIISNEFVGKTYGEARYVLEEADKNPLENSVWCFYEENTANANWDGGTTWNREHVWARSRGVDGNTDNSEISMASDIHNLKAETPSVNSNKSNYNFAYKPSDKAFVGTHSSKAYAPKVSARGDAARIMFYMAVKYGESGGIEISDEVSATNSTSQGNLVDLLMWHTEDPVDPFEVRRNNVIFKYQKNRNPFIDHPELVDHIFGDKQNQKWNGGIVYNP